MSIIFFSVSPIKRLRPGVLNIQLRPRICGSFWLVSMLSVVLLMVAIHDCMLQIQREEYSIAVVVTFLFFNRKPDTGN